MMMPEVERVSGISKTKPRERCSRVMSKGGSSFSIGSARSRARADFRKSLHFYTAKTRGRHGAWEAISVLR